MGANGFCPKCGAIIHNGVCTSCGYSARVSETQQYSYTQAGQTQPEVQLENIGRFSGNAGGTGAYNAQNIQPKQSGSKAWILIVVIILLCILVPLFLFVVLFSQVSNVVGNFQQITPEPGWEFSFEDLPFSEEPASEEAYDWEEDYTYEEYIPSPADEYYEEIVSATTRGLSYDIAWNSSSLFADDEEVLAGFYYYYPIVIGSDEAFVNKINTEIAQQALSYEVVELTEDNYGYVDAYVTYMSEERLSVVFLYYSDEGGRENYHISALNYDMTTGAQIPLEEIIPQFEFVEMFRKTCEVQNGYYSAAELESMSDAEIMDAITNPETGVAFYSPVGVDLGFNYEGGWMTVTLKFGEY